MRDKGVVESVGPALGWSSPSYTDTDTNALSSNNCCETVSSHYEQYRTEVGSVKMQKSVVYEIEK